MTNLLAVLPDFHVAPFSHIIPSLERALVSTADLLSLDALDVARRAQVPPGEVTKLAQALLHSLHVDCAAGKAPQDLDGWHGFEGVPDLADRWTAISTLDDRLDLALRGGIARRHLTEIVGESAAGKTQFLLTLLLSSQLPPSEGASQRSALYISTEAPLQTTRLTQILENHPRLSTLPADQRPSLSRVHSTHIHDVEAQEHILRYQVPVAIQRHNVGLLVIDSIAANYRAEFDKGGKSIKNAAAVTKRANHLAQIGALLRDLARKHDIAVVVANQVADRFTAIEPTFQATSQSTQGARPASPLPSLPQQMPPQPTGSMLSTDDPFALDHQQRFFTGWGDDANVTNLKTPSLGLTWTNQLCTRLALLKDPIYEDKAYSPGDERNLIGWKRSCKVVFSAWCGQGETDFEIWEGGVRNTSQREAASTSTTA